MIPVFDPLISPEDVDAVSAALHRGELSGNFGISLQGFEEEFAQFCGCRFGIATTNGTTALQLAVACLGIGPGDEVLVSASTNIATALAAVHCGALPVPVDVEPDTWNIDIAAAERCLTPRTRAIIPVHLFGNPADMTAIMQFAVKHQLAVIEDCAQAHGAQWGGKTVGSFGAFGCFSFYTNKIITTGEGGMLTTNDPQLAERARYLRNVAFGTPRFVHQEAGFNFRMTGYQAALGRSQLGRIDDILRAKKRLATRYADRLRDLPVIVQAIAGSASPVYWVNAIRIPESSPIDRDRVSLHLKERGIDTRTFFCPMNEQPCLQKLPGFRQDACPRAETLWETGLYLPSSPQLSDSDLDIICDALRDVLAPSARGTGST